MFYPVPPNFHEGQVMSDTCTKCGTHLPEAWVKAANADKPPANPFTDAFPQMFGSLADVLRPLLCWACKVGAK